VLNATLKSLLSRKLRLLLSGTAVILAVLFMAGALVLNATLQRSFDNAFTGAYSGVDIQVTKPDDVIAQSTVDKIDNATGIVQINGARLIGENGKVAPNGRAPRLGVNWRGQGELREGRGPQHDDEIAINAFTAKKAGVHVGERVDVLTKEPRKTFTVVGIYGYSDDRDSLAGEQEVAFTEPVAQQLMLGQTGVYSAVDVTGTTVDALKRQLGPGYQVQTGKELAAAAAADQKGFFTVMTNILLGFAGVAVFVGAFLILNTFSIIVAQRTRELALMRALGGTRRQLVTSVLIEAATVGFVAALIGIGLGIGVGDLVARILIGQADGTLQIAPLQFPIGGLVGCLLVGTVTTVLAAVFPALRASRVAPIAALRETADQPKPMIRLAIAGGVLTAAGTALVIRMANPTQLLIGVLCAFAGVALLTPLIAGPVVTVLGRVVKRSVPGDLGRRNSARNPRRTAITAAALMIGVALVTAGSTITSSIKASLAEAIGGSLTADLAVFGDTGNGTTIDSQRMAQIRGIQTVDLVAGSANAQATVGGRSAFVETWDDNGAANLLMSRHAVQGTVDIVSGQVMLSQSEAKDRNVTLGDHLRITLPRGEADYTVAGIYADTRIDDGIIMAWADAQKTFPRVLVSAAFIKVQSGRSVADTQQQVNQVLDDPELSAQTVQQAIDQLDGVFDLILNVVQGLLAVAMIIAVLGIVNTLVLSVLERTRELGLLRAVGLRRGQLLRMITVESVLISLFGAILGLVVGALLGAAVTRGLRNEGFDQLAMPWTQMAVYLVAAALVGVLAAIAPAIRGARLNVLAAIAYE
jgi:putative ABC transport system permease protein